MLQEILKPWQDEISQRCQAWIPERSIVLVIEPHTMWRMFLKALLNLYQYQVVTATTEWEAEAMKREIGLAELGLVITDVHLSDDLQAHAGIKLFKRWTAIAPRLPFLLMSDNANDANLPSIRTERMNFLAKPFIRQDVLEAVILHLSSANMTKS
jgi:DNA-binding NtrC family response regulator